jgi:1-acyl-sn-glycerol-3-phosphate acyltransferase
MSDAFYKLVRTLGHPVFWLASKPTVLHADRMMGNAPFILAPNHLSPYDVPCLMASSRRVLDFVSIAELFRRPVVGWFLTNMNAFGLDRSRPDPATTRIILDRLAHGRTVAMFPEGRIRRAEDSVLNGGSFKASVTRLARLAGVPIVPCVVLATGAFSSPIAWLPLRRTRYAVCFGDALQVNPEGDEETACAQATQRLRHAYEQGYAELRDASGLRVEDYPWRGGGSNVAVS